MPRKEMVRWTEDEWDAIAESVAISLLNEPSTSLVVLVNNKVQQFPAARRRKITTLLEIQSAISRIKTIYLKMREDLQELESLRAKVASHRTADEIMDSLTDTEVVNRFGSRVLHLMTPDEILSNYTTEQLLEGVPTARLAGEATRRVVEDVLHHPVIRQINLTQQAVPTGIVSTKKRLPKVCVVGVTNRQQAHVNKHLAAIADLRFVDVHGHRSHDIPAGMDIYAAMLKFIAHPTEAVIKKLATPGNYIPHQGGMERLIAALQDKIVEWHTHVRT